MNYGTTKPPAGARILRGHPLAPDGVCLLLNEQSGSGIRDAVSGRMFSPSSANWSRVTASRGPALQITDTSTYYDLGVPWYLKPEQCTIVMGYRKTDATLRGSCPFAIDNNFRCQVHLPFTDGKVYFDYAGAAEGFGRVSVAGLTMGDDIWAFVAKNDSASGRQIWQNGTLRVSGPGSSLMSTVPNLPLRLNTSQDLGGDLGEYQFFYVYRRALSASEIAQVSTNPYAFLETSPPLRFFGGFTPTPITTVVKSKGKGIPPLRIPSSGSATFAALSQAVFAVSADFDGTAILYNGAGVSQGAMTQDARANNSGKIQSLIFSKYIPSAGSYYAIFTMGAAGNAAGALLEIANVAAASQLDQTAAATGSSTSPSSGATSATTQAYEVVIGAIGTEGPGGDTQGSWSNGFQPIAYTGTTGGAAAANVSLSVGYKIVNATGAQTAAKTGITSRQWGAAVATYKGLVASAPAADPVTYLTTSPLNAGTVGDFYSEYFEVYGGVAPYTYAVQSGSLPGGLSLATDGGLSGTPTLAGVYTFTVRATDSAVETEDLACSLTISAAAAGRRKPKTHILTMPGRFF